MKAKHSLLAFLLAAFCIFYGCTSNPFGDDKISEEKRNVSGTIKLADQTSAKDVYVWLAGFNLGAYTDEQGQFQLTLPPKGGQGTPGGVSGVFNLYPYLANYHLDSAVTVIQNGLFVYSRGDINKDGKLAASKVLRRFLRISTVVSPTVVSKNFSGNIGVTVTLEALDDSATVIFPRSVGGLLGAVLFKRIGAEEVFVFEFSPGANTRDITIVGRAPKSRVMLFNLLQVPLPPGQYEVIPYLLVRHQALPKGLMESLAANVETLGPDYLKLPFRREGGLFEVTP